MSKLLKICKQCNKHPLTDEMNGFYGWLGDDDYECPVCKLKLTDSVVTSDEYLILFKTSKEISFLEAMIELKQSNPIEYQLKIQQFEIQLQQQKQTQQAANNTSDSKNIPKCPTCSSANIKKISGLSKAGSIAMWGIFSRKAHKQWHCNNCGTEW